MTDLINGLLELGGALITLLSVRQILRDRVMMGFHWGPTIFFTGWGVWNLYFYPSIGMPISTAGAAALVLVNAVYLSLMLRFWNGNRRKSPEYIITWHPGVYDPDMRERLRRTVSDRAIQLAGERMRAR
jgi:hypothetical protein